MSLPFGVHGATGRLGRLILAEGGPRVVALTRSGPVPALAGVIDVSRPEGTRELLARLNGEPLLVGTTGELPWEALEAYALRAPVAVLANFSLGVPLLAELIASLTPRLPPGWDLEMVEAHHKAKVDAPSGTALRLARATGRDLPIHSIRAGDTFGDHTLYLCGPGERIELRHVATRREVFAIGALREMASLVGQPPGLRRG